MKRKFAAAILAVMMAVTFTAPEAFAAEAASADAAEETGTAGVYKLIEMEQDGEVTSREDIETMESLGLVVYLDLAEDGSVSLNMFGEDISGSWTDDSLTLEGEKVNWSLEGSELTVEEDGTSMTFEKTTREYIDSIAGGDTADTEDSESGASADSGPTEIITIEDGKVIDTEDCRMEITGFEPAGEAGYTIYATCENKTADKNMRFSISDGAVNGYMADPFWATDTVAPGTTIDTTIEYDNEELSEIGALEPQEFLWALWVYDSDDYGANPYFDEVVAIYPDGKPAEPVVPAERRTTDTETVLVDNDDITVIILDNTATDWSHDFTAYIENKKDFPVMVSWDNVTVNGTEVDPFWATELLPGTRAYSTISFSNSDLEANNITDISEITCDMTAYNADDWMADYLLEDTYTFNP